MSAVAQEARGCSSHSCVVRRPTGMATNGPCRCDERTLRRAVLDLRGELAGRLEGPAEAALQGLHWGLAHALGLSPQERQDLLLRRVKEEHVELLRLRQAVVVLPTEKRRRLRPRRAP